MISPRAFGPKVAENIARAGRAGHPSEIADVILFLASSQSAWIKGQDITIDGGMSAMGMTDMMELKG
ncbi:MAG: SDR family oxidoreductase [Paracoccaceae bacterium]